MKYPKLSPMTEKLNGEGVKRVCAMMILQTMKDVSLKKGDIKHSQAVYGNQAIDIKKEAWEFANSGWLITICEIYEIDYPSVLKEVRRIYRGGKIAKRYQLHF